MCAYIYIYIHRAASLEYGLAYILVSPDTYSLVCCVLLGLRDVNKAFTDTLPHHTTRHSDLRPGVDARVPGEVSQVPLDLRLGFRA